MASNIIIGSLIACKLLISPNIETRIEEKQKSIQESVQKSGSGTNIMLGNITKKLQEAARKSQPNSISELDENKEEKIIIGTVLNIEEKEYWKKNTETNKFFKKKKKTLKVKSDNFVDVLYISEDACGLYEDIVETQEYIDNKDDVVKIENADSKEKVVIKKSTKKKINKEEYEEEYIIVPLDYDLKNKENLKEIKDTDTKKKINEALNNYLKKNNYNIRTEEEKIAIQKKIKDQEEFYKKIAEKQKNIFSEHKKELEAEVIQKEDQMIIEDSMDGNIADNQKKVEKKEESFFGMNIVAKFEDDVKKEQENKIDRNNEETIDNKIVTKDKNKEEKIKITKENRNDFSNGALITRAFKIILKEW